PIRPAVAPYAKSTGLVLTGVACRIHYHTCSYLYHNCGNLYDTLGGSHMADAEHPFIRRSKVWPKHTSDAVLVMNPDYANAIRQSLEYLTTPLTEVADHMEVNYRTLQSYAAM